MLRCFRLEGITRKGIIQDITLNQAKRYHATGITQLKTKFFKEKALQVIKKQVKINGNLCLVTEKRETKAKYQRAPFSLCCVT